MTIVPLLRDSAFEPDDIKVMSAALDEVCDTLHLTDRAKAAREVIAERIIELARRGERSPTRLRDRVLKETGLDGETNGAKGSNGNRWSGM
jgi:tartrate dehydratase beta subunit/fumarate hydratase class I family protein